MQILPRPLRNRTIWAIKQSANKSEVFVKLVLLSLLAISLNSFSSDKDEKSTWDKIKQKGQQVKQYAIEKGQDFKHKYDQDIAPFLKEKAKQSKEKFDEIFSELSRDFSDVSEDARDEFNQKILPHLEDFGDNVEAGYEKYLKESVDNTVESAETYYENNRVFTWDEINNQIDELCKTNQECRNKFVYETDNVDKNSLKESYLDYKAKYVITKKIRAYKRELSALELEKQQKIQELLKDQDVYEI